MDNKRKAGSSTVADFADGDDRAAKRQRVPGVSCFASFCLLKFFQCTLGPSVYAVSLSLVSIRAVVLKACGARNRFSLSQLHQTRTSLTTKAGWANRKCSNPPIITCCRARPASLRPPTAYTSSTQFEGRRTRGGFDLRCVAPRTGRARASCWLTYNSSPLPY